MNHTLHDSSTKVFERNPARISPKLFLRLSILLCTVFLLLRFRKTEIQNAKASGKPFRDNRYVDVYREKQIRVVVKVIVPVKEHPKFNFVGKLLGPRGNSMRRLQEETLCKMAILGRGSMKDRKRVS